MVLTLVPIVGILQSLSSNAFPTGLTHHISKGVTFDTPCRRYECMRALYHELVAFIPPAKDEWDFCRGGLKQISLIQIIVLLYIKILLFRVLVWFYEGFIKRAHNHHGYQ